MTDLSKDIKSLLKKKGYNQRRLCSDIKITEQGFSRSLKTGNIRMYTLKQIAKVCETELIVQFGNDNNETKNSINDHLIRDAYNQIVQLKKEIMILENEFKIMGKPCPNFDSKRGIFLPLQNLGIAPVGIVAI